MTALSAMGEAMTRRAMVDHLALVRSEIADMDAKARALVERLEALCVSRKAALATEARLKAELADA